MSAPTRQGDGIAPDPGLAPPSATPPDDASYDARFGYRQIDVLRYERRRYGSPVRRFNLRLVVRAILSGLENVPAGGLVLDAPCGTGILGEPLRARGLQVVAADISPAMLDVAHARGVGRGWVRADLERPPFQVASFDGVVCNRFLMHLPSATRVAVLRAMASISRGPLVVTVCHPYTVKSGLRALRRFVGAHAKRSPRITRPELESEVAAAGLRLVRLIPVMPLLSEIWVAVLDRPSAAGT
jgi:SAM-dependent methyltransferase